MWVGKLLSGVKSMYFDSLAYARGESERFRIDSGMIRVYHVVGFLNSMELELKKKHIKFNLTFIIF